MICEKCGSNNPKNSAVCTNCGAKMPTTEVCGGFADILSYEGPVSTAASGGSGVDDKTIQKLERKVNAAISTGRKLTVLTFISLTLSLVVLILFILTSCNFGGCISDSKKETTPPPTNESTNDETKKLEDTTDIPENNDEEMKKGDDQKGDDQKGDDQKGDDQKGAIQKDDEQIGNKPKTDD